MKARYQVRCRACGEKTNPAELFCSHCGGSLRAQGYKANGHVRIFRLAGKVLATLLMVLVPLAAMAGFGFVIYHFFFAPADAETVTTTTTRAIVETTTSTTAPAPTQTFTLISDTDRYGTAIAVSKQGFPRGAAAAVLSPW